jgi:hypothetical protein
LLKTRPDEALDRECNHSFPGGHFGAPTLIRRLPRRVVERYVRAPKAMIVFVDATLCGRFVSLKCGLASRNASD